MPFALRKRKKIANAIRRPLFFRGNELRREAKQAAALPWGKSGKIRKPLQGGAESRQEVKTNQRKENIKMENYADPSNQNAADYERGFSDGCRDNPRKRIGERVSHALRAYLQGFADGETAQDEYLDQLLLMYPD